MKLKRLIGEILNSRLEIWNKSLFTVGLYVERIKKLIRLFKRKTNFGYGKH